MTKRIPVMAIRNRVVRFLEDLPEPRAILYGTPIYDIAVEIEGDTYTLELYHGGLVKELKVAGALKGRKAMIQLPEQAGAKWGARVFVRAFSPHEMTDDEINQQRIRMKPLTR